MLTTHNQASIDKYRSQAVDYDSTCGPTQPIRAQTIARLQLKTGDTVLDVGCGTGMSFGPLLERIGPTGRLLAFEQSPEMWAQAHARIHAQGWKNIDLAQTNAESYQAPHPIHAVLMHYVHDISRTDTAINNLFTQLRPGTRVAMAGMKYFSPMLCWLNWLARSKNRPYNVRYADLKAPWDKVQRYIPHLQLQSTQMGMGYIAHGITSSTY